MDPLSIIHNRCIYASYNFQLVMSLLECPWDLGSAPAERVRQGEVAGFQQWAQIAWLLLGLESPWLALGEPFLSFFT